MWYKDDVVVGIIRPVPVVAGSDQLFADLWSKICKWLNAVELRAHDAERVKSPSMWRLTHFTNPQGKRNQWGGSSSNEWWPYEFMTSSCVMTSEWTCTVSLRHAFFSSEKTWIPFWEILTGLDESMFSDNPIHHQLKRLTRLYLPSSSPTGKSRNPGTGDVCVLQTITHFWRVVITNSSRSPLGIWITTW